MELRVLRYFLMVAREENITKAAELLYITQPTLSRQLSQLEDELGVKLFQRGQHGISLTEDGMLLRRRAQEIVALAEKAERELSHTDDVLSGEIAIGSGETKNIEILTAMMAEFRSKHPDVTFDIYAASADDIKERLERGLVDIGVLGEPADISRSISSVCRAKKGLGYWSELTHRWWKRKWSLRKIWSVRRCFWSNDPV